MNSYNCYVSILFSFLNFILCSPPPFFLYMISVLYANTNCNSYLWMIPNSCSSLYPLSNSPCLHSSYPNMTSTLYCLNMTSTLYCLNMTSTLYCLNMTSIRFSSICSVGHISPYYSKCYSPYFSLYCNSCYYSLYYSSCYSLYCIPYYANYYCSWCNN